MTKLSKYFPSGLLPGLVVPYAHKGEWAVHQVLPFLFAEMGPFNLSIATFNISEDALRPIFFMKENDELLNIRFLFDANIKRHKLDMLLFSANIAHQVRTSSSHMKVMLCHNDDFCLSVVGSANMNLNPRHEAGFFSTDQEIFDYYMNYYNDIYDNDSIPFILPE